MRELQLIVLLWVIAVLMIAGWRLFVSSMAQYSVDRQTDQYNEGIRKALAE